LNYIEFTIIKDISFFNFKIKELVLFIKLLLTN